MPGWNETMSRWGWMWWAPPGFVMVGTSFLVLGVLQRRIEEAWEELAAAYPDDVAGLARTFGQYLATAHPEVRAHHGERRVEFAAGPEDRLVLETDEPLRTSRGWGGAHLQGWRGGRRVALPGADLYLTFARGLHPEWVARWPGIPPRRALVNDAFVAHVAGMVFGPPAPGAAGTV
jgi:hypothetical protein